MSLPAGTRIGTYEIVSALGAGGMGEVYRAADTTLGRDVAIKVLPGSFVADPGRMARFRREAHVLASLNHPNIAAIYGFEESALVMELVEGVTLAERIAAGRVPFEEAIAIATQIAGALEYAHEQGVVHRDLKPANIKIKPDGSVKLLDFGLAKIIERPAAGDASPSAGTVIATTQMGSVLGTPAYASPEQARGKPVDKRTDIWAFGVILYELLSGRRPFRGESVPDVLAAMLTQEPDWTPIPRAAQRLVRRCLEKDLRLRLRDIGDMAALLDEPPQTPGLQHPPRLPAKRPWRSTLVAAAAIVAAVIAWRYARPAPESGWSGVRLGGSNVALAPRVSPDGKLIAFIAMVDGLTQVALMKPESGNWTALTHNRSHGNVGEVSWSRDGTKIYFDRADETPRGIYSVPALGGDERLVLEHAATPEVLGDGSLLVVRLNAERRAQAHRFWPETGRVQALRALLSTTLQNSPMLRAAGGSEKAVFWGKPLDEPDAADHLYVMDLKSDTIQPLAPGVSFPANLRYLPFAIRPDGRVAVFDVPAGDLHRIVSAGTDGSRDLHTLFTLPTITAYLDVAADGSVYVDQWERPFDVIRFSADGDKPEYIATATGPTLGVVPLPDGRVVFDSLNADRQRLQVAGVGQSPAPFVETQEDTSLPMAVLGQTHAAFLIGPAATRTIAIASIADGRVTRRLSGSLGARIGSMAAAPDGKTIYYTSAGSVWAIAADDGRPRSLRTGDGVTVDPYKQELIVTLLEKEGVRLVAVPLTGGPERAIRVEGDLRLASGSLSPAAVSPDGRILVRVVPPASWFYPTGLLDPATGQIRIPRIGYDADMGMAGWTADNKIVAAVAPLRSTLWHFRPALADR